MNKRKWEACPPRGQWDWTVFGPDGIAALVHTGEADAKRFAASAALLEACEKALMNSTRSRSADCVFCGAAIGEEHATDCPTMPLRAAIRAAAKEER